MIEMGWDMVALMQVNISKMEQHLTAANQMTGSEMLSALATGGATAQGRVSRAVVAIRHGRKLSFGMWWPCYVTE